MKTQLQTQWEVRRSFWATQFANNLTKHKRMKHNEYPATIRTMFSEYIDRIARDGIIDETLAKRATL
jgi:hypothetical protein